MKNKAKHQNDVICFRKIYNKMSKRDCQKNNKKAIDGDGSTIDTTATKKPIGDGLHITTVTAMTTGIFFGLMAVGVEQQGELLISTSFVYFMSFFRTREAWHDDKKSLYN